MPPPAPPCPPRDNDDGTGANSNRNPRQREVHALLRRNRLRGLQPWCDWNPQPERNRFLQFIDLHRHPNCQRRLQQQHPNQRQPRHPQHGDPYRRRCFPRLHRPHGRARLARQPADHRQQRLLPMHGLHGPAQPTCHTHQHRFECLLGLHGLFRLAHPAAAADGCAR